jgi:multidrug resistance efflux pump
MKKLGSLALTLVLLVAIAWVSGIIWDKYMYTPWTRDGRLRSNVVSIAPDVSGWITKLDAENAQQVKAGDTLFEIDPHRYQAALELAEARADAARIELRRSQDMMTRRQRVLDGAVSGEENDLAKIDVAAKRAAVSEAEASVKAAQIDLDRTTYRAPISGKVINLSTEVGDYVTRGVEKLAIINTASYYLTGYFEETKIPSIHVGDAVDIWLMAGKVQLKGHVRSIDAGISNKNMTAGNQQLPEVEATFTWLRLAQRIPVDISIDALPAGLDIASGMSATLRVHPQSTGVAQERSAGHAIASDVTAVLK